MSLFRFNLNLFLLTVLPLFPYPRWILAEQYVGDACDLTNGNSGRCEMIEKCRPMYEKLLAGVPPDTLCGFSGFVPIVCCPSAESSTIPNDGSTLVTTTTRSNIVDTSSGNGDRPKKSANLARQKCGEYAASVYAMVEPPTLSTYRKPVNVSLCAIESKKLIVGGTRADPKEFPHMAAVGFLSGRSNGKILWLCGGTLVSDKFVMTAAHCTYSLQYGNAVRVRLGDLNLATNYEDARPQERRVVERIRHPAYRKPAEYHDLALLRLESPLAFDAYTRPACLPFSSEIPEERVVATGWGRVSWDDGDDDDDDAGGGGGGGVGGGSNHLLKVTLATVSQQLCNASFFTAATSVDLKLPRGIVDDWQICAGQEGRDTCQGDSGGPLVVFHPNYECMYTVVGITSLGRLCGSAVPGVYTRVYNYVSWLQDIMWR